MNKDTEKIADLEKLVSIYQNSLEIKDLLIKELCTRLYKLEGIAYHHKPKSQQGKIISLVNFPLYLSSKKQQCQRKR